MTTLVALCRSGYEAVLVDEITHKLAVLNVSGYGQFTKASAWVLFHVMDTNIDITACLKTLVFSRQLWWKHCDVSMENKQDRVSDIIYQLRETPLHQKLYQDIIVEYPDTESGKVLAKFARKFTVPLRQALRNVRAVAQREKVREKKANLSQKHLHLLMLDFETGILGESIPQISRTEPGGITRLKFPPNAPSRSTLKLEDAINSMLTPLEQSRLFYSGANAVDLGACPGGWTFQLVQRGMHVEAIDNGKIDESLMETGQVQHFSLDGFTYAPAYGHVTLLVCDMIEKPDRVTELMAKWLVNGWADHAIFNLKLPMKQRFDTIQRCLHMLTHTLSEKRERSFRIAAKHLYHDRDEVTVVVIAD